MSLAGMGFDSKRDFAPPTILLGLPFALVCGVSFFLPLDRGYLNAEFQRIARIDEKAFLSDQCKEIEEKIEWERLEISSRKLKIPRDRWHN